MGHEQPRLFHKYKEVKGRQREKERDENESESETERGKRKKEKKKKMANIIGFSESVVLVSRILASNGRRTRKFALHLTPTISTPSPPHTLAPYFLNQHLLLYLSFSRCSLARSFLTTYMANVRRNTFEGIIMGEYGLFSRLLPLHEILRQ